jgi:hypothetical protein
MTGAFVQRKRPNQNEARLVVFHPNDKTLLLLRSRILIAPRPAVAKRRVGTCHNAPVLTGVMTEMIPITKKLSGIPPAWPVHSLTPGKEMSCLHYLDVVS